MSRADRIAYTAFAVNAAVFAGLLAARLAHYGVPLLPMVLTSVSSGSGMFLALTHLYAAVQRARKAGR